MTEKEIFRIMEVQKKAMEASTALHGARYYLTSIDPLFTKTEPYKLLSQAIDSLDKFFKILREKEK